MYIIAMSNGYDVLKLVTILRSNVESLCEMDERYLSIDILRELRRLNEQLIDEICNLQLSDEKNKLNVISFLVDIRASLSKRIDL